MPQKGSIVAHIAEQRPAGRHRRGGRRLRPLLSPEGPILDYSTVLVQLVTLINQRAKALIGPQLERWTTEARGDSTRMDAWYDEAARAIEQLRIQMRTDPPYNVTRLTRNIANEVDEAQRRKWIQVTRAALGVRLLTEESWLSGSIEAFVADNVQLITNLSQEYIDQIGQTVNRGVRAGLRHESIAKQVFSPTLPAGRFRQAKTRARLIARDQINKLNGQLTERRQTDIGVEEYIWRTAGDTRVRSQDQAQAGKKYRWDRPPPGGHPGQKVNCRCYAEPVFGDEFDSPEVRAAPKGKV